MKYTAILFLIGALASAGLPPFNGFASKILIYESVYKFNPILAIVAVIVSIITLAIFVKAFFSAFAGQSLPEYKEVKDAPRPMMAAMLVLTVAIVLFGLFPGLVVNWMATPAAKALINQGSYIQAVLGGR
jgi:multicomponent Na+:H+ antiporter subunit D